MRKIMSSLLLILIFSSIALTQFQADISDPKMHSLIWGNKSECKVCDQLMIDGQEFRSIIDSEITLFVTIYSNDDFWMADAYIANNGKERFTFDPKVDTGLLIWTKKDKSKSQPTRILSTIPPEKIVSKIEKVARWGNAFRSMAASMSTVKSTIVTQETSRVTLSDGSGGRVSGNVAGTSTTTVTTPNLEARRNAANENNESLIEARKAGDSVLQGALKGNTIFPSGKIFGTIYYEKKGHPVDLIAAFRLNGKYYFFVYRVVED